MNIKFKRVNLLDPVINKGDKLWAYDVIKPEYNKNECILDYLNTSKFQDYNGNQYSSLRIVKSSFNNEWVLRASTIENIVEMPIIRSKYKTKKELIEYVNKTFTAI